MSLAIRKHRPGTGISFLTMTNASMSILVVLGSRSALLVSYCASLLLADIKLTPQGLTTATIPIPLAGATSPTASSNSQSKVDGLEGS